MMRHMLLTDENPDQVHLRAECTLTCSRKSCVESVFVTDLDRSSTVVGTGDDDFKFDSANLTSYTIEVNVNKRPTIVTVFSPALSMTSFFIYLMSCFGVW